MKVECDQGCSHGLLGRYKQSGESEPCSCEGGFLYYCDVTEVEISREEHEENDGLCNACYREIHEENINREKEE